ncbi:LAFE_0F01926g1_1 [Lachancea fermentati]|uniref:LAFE_0F01926g1_1 n=1 Tax=Lachancea fermentati TaxID=4955 RepID=A0A1G4MEQ6_LACFM|nr:LAFE_0F01926g1_1 [Lachancea fermentati]
MGNKHLFVLVHGLWGNYKHMNSIKEVFIDTFDDPDVVFFSPKQSGYFKTFDGIEIVGYRTLLEICQFIFNFKGGKITKISFVGYSMGGLISRFIIGKMFTECHELFHNIEPMLFITFATPHLGVQFFLPETRGNHQKRLLNKVLSVLGTTILGRSGRQLFIKDKHSQSGILVRLSSGEYLQGLAKFKHRICVANVKNDRTVAFYTSFITDCDPFLETNNEIHYEFEKQLPGSDLCMVPRIVDMDNLDPQTSRKSINDGKFSRLLLIGLICCIIVFMLPLIFIANVGGTCYSYLATVHFQKLLHEGEGRVLLRRKLGLQDKIADTIRDATGILSNEEYGIQKADQDQTISQEVISWDEFVAKYSNSWKKKSKSRFTTLDFDPNRKHILDNLNMLPWIRIPLYIKALNAHDGIVARKGIDKTSPYNLSGLQFVAQLAKFLISKD